MIALRFTKNKEEKNLTSEDQVNKVQFHGLCAYDMTSEIDRMMEGSYTMEEAIKICALRQVKYDNWHASNKKGHYVVFDADFVEWERDNHDYTRKRAVIVTINNYLAYGQIDMESERYRMKSIELV